MLTLPLLALIGLSGFARAEWIELPWAAVGATLPIWKPDNFDTSKTYPAIIWYGDNGARPDATWIHKMTGGKDFVLVGMGYRQVEPSEYGEREIADGQGLLNALKKTLTASLSVDERRIHVGGFSRGGWHSAMLLDRDRSLAGGLICGAGIQEKRSSVLKLSNTIPIYIGCGRYDGKYPQALGALVYFRGMSADVTLDTWAETGHALPGETPEAIRQWLRIQAKPTGLAAEAGKWIANRLPELDAIPNPVARWFAYDEFVSLPFMKRYGDEASKTAAKKIAELVKGNAVATERKWRGETRKLLARESRNKLLKTVAAASAGYAVIAEKAAGTRAGEAAIHDLARTREMLKTAAVVTLPGKPKPGPITLDRPPSAPSANPDRGPFLPPGIKVKPAK